MRKIKYLLFIILFCICGCAGGQKVAPEKPKAIFYPAAPDEPRLQFLMSFSSSEELEGPEGGFRKFIVGDEFKSRPIVKPYGVTVHGHKIYICDTVHNGIDILDLAARKFEYFRPKEGSQLASPINLAFDEEGNMYVADSGRGQVVIFDPEGNSAGAIGKKSELKPTGVLIRGDKVYICDLITKSVKVFGLKGRQYISSIPKEGAAEDAKLFAPTNIAADEEGNIYISDTSAFKVKKYDANGEFLMAIGSLGDALGQFARPKGVAVDSEGRVYIVDAAFENVQIFDKEGKLLMFFAEPGGSAASLVLPAGIAIDYSLKDYFSGLAAPDFEVEYLVLVTSQYGDRKLSIYGFGHRKE